MTPVWVRASWPGAPSTIARFGPEAWKHLGNAAMKTLGEDVIVEVQKYLRTNDLPLPVHDYEDCKVAVKDASPRVRNVARRQFSSGRPPTTTSDILDIDGLGVTVLLGYVLALEAHLEKKSKTRSTTTQARSKTSPSGEATASGQIQRIFNEMEYGGREIFARRMAAATDRPTLEDIGRELKLTPGQAKSIERRTGTLARAEINAPTHRKLRTAIDKIRQQKAPICRYDDLRRDAFAILGLDSSAEHGDETCDFLMWAAGYQYRSGDYVHTRPIKEIDDQINTASKRISEASDARGTSPILLKGIARDLGAPIEFVLWRSRQWSLQSVGRRIARTTDSYQHIAYAAMENTQGSATFEAIMSRVAVVVRGLVDDGCYVKTENSDLTDEEVARRLSATKRRAKRRGIA